MSYANFVETQLDGPVTAEGLSLQLQPAQAPYQLPPADGGVLVLADSMGKPAAVEIIRYAARDGLTLTGLERGLEGTVALNWPGNSYCYQSLTAGGFEAVKEIIDVHVADQNPHPQYLVAESAVSLDRPASTSPRPCNSRSLTTTCSAATWCRSRQAPPALPAARSASPRPWRRAA
jgi:hypothetical protein